MNNFKFGKHSFAESVGVNHDLILLSDYALWKSPIDFGRYDGLRTREEQEEYVRTGASNTLHSKHLTGDALDLVPYINGKYRWEQDACVAIAMNMHQGSIFFGIPVRWGAVWDRLLSELDVHKLPQEIEKYIERRRLLGKKAFIDAVHYELT